MDSGGFAIPGARELVVLNAAADTIKPIGIRCNYAHDTDLAFQQRWMLRAIGLMNGYYE